jgi:hypothetical protein
MTRLLGTLTLVAILAGIVFYASGWISWDRTEDRTTIEIETREIQEATEKAVEEGKRVVEDALEGVRSEEPEQETPAEPKATEP